MSDIVVLMCKYIEMDVGVCVYIRGETEMMLRSENGENRIDDDD